MREGEPVFVDSGAWIALALTGDPFHSRAREIWELLLAAGTRLHTSVPVILEKSEGLENDGHRGVKPRPSRQQQLPDLPGAGVEGIAGERQGDPGPAIDEDGFALAHQGSSYTVSCSVEVRRGLPS